MIFGVKFRKAKDAAQDALTNLDSQLKRVDGFKAAGGTPTADMLKDARDAGRKLKVSHLELKSARGEFGASIQNLFSKMGNVIGIKPNGKVSAEYVEKVEKFVNNGEISRVSKFERVLSKPFRMLAKYPKMALAGTALLTVMGIGSVVNKKAEERTQNDALQEAIQTQALMEQQAQNAPAAQANVTYQITPEEYASLQAQMRGGDGTPQTGHAENVMASRQQQQPSGSPLSAL